ncbi:hypothetical protein H7J86_24620 [Mycobacterium hackensackense]|uniref:hypothetical protein n=1 Tax=Mycobacterium hackensackense TaxID=228909 RepID=UPI0022657DB4|nr:hypothetical protein [Mycobacterium hackensackense]MCV7255352.1 hypothetical protein [Mycobacterium hackensackense]
MSTPDWVTAIPSAPVHEQDQDQFTRAFSPQQMLSFGAELIEQFLRRVVQAVRGVFVNGVAAFDQLFDWAQELAGAAFDAFNKIGRLISRVGGEVIEDVGDAIKGTAITLSKLSSDLLHNTAAVIGSIPQALVSGLNGALNVLDLGIKAAKSFVQQVIDAILSGLKGIPIIGGFIADMQKAVKQQKADQQAFTISAIVSDYRNPKSRCRYPIADVTYDEVLNNHMYVFGTTDDASAGTAHTHTVGSSNSAVAAPAGWSVNQHESRGSYLTITNTTVHDTFGAVVWKDAGTLNNVYLELLRINSDGSLVRIAAQEFSSSITTATRFFEFTLPSRLIVQAGETFVLRIRNSSTVATTVRVLGMERIDSAPDDGFKTVGSTLTSQTSYTAAQATTARANGNTLCWFMLAAKFMPDVDKLFSDSFKYIAISGQWVRQSSTAALIDVYEEALGYTGTLDGDQSALYIRRCTRDVNKVEANLYVNPNSTVRVGLLLHCARDFSQVVYLGVNGTSAKIYSGPIDLLTERASLATGGTGKWSLYYDAAADKYVALLNGATVGLQWTSVGSAVAHGEDYRFGGARIECAAGEPAGTVDDWELRDWYVAVPAMVFLPRMEATAAMRDLALSAAATVSLPRMEATAGMADLAISAGAVIDLPRMEAAASMAAINVSDNTEFPYAFGFELG